MNKKIIVVTHKDYQMPNEEMYLPICVGSGIKTLFEKFQPDNVGDNLSEKNSTYCELTAIYWAWKNLNAEIIGVAHYRRHFTMIKGARTLDKALTSIQLDQLYAKHGENTIFATPARHYFGSIENHYIHSLKGYEEIHLKDIERLKQAIHTYDASYDECAKNVLCGKSAHMLNMFIMNRANFEAYCEWLFSVINLVVSLSEDREDQRRYAGALSEFCLDIWTQKNGLKIVEIPLLETEKKSFFARVKGYIKRKI